MTLLFFDGFETYGLSATMADGLEDVYDLGVAITETDVTIETSDRITDGQLVQVNSNVIGNDGNDLAKGLQLPIAALSTQDDWILGVALRLPDGKGASGEYLSIFEFIDTDGSHMCSLRLNGDGTIDLARINPGISSTVIDTGSESISDATEWHYIELKIKFHGSTGEYECRVTFPEQDSHTVVMSGTGANTSASGETRPGQVRSGHFSGKRVQWDDFYVLDDQGSLNTDFLGEVFVQRVRPNAVGDSSQFTASSGGDNYTDVDEDAEDDDTTYVESNTVGEKDLYHYENLAETPGTIFGVIAKPVVRKSEGGSRTFQVLSKSGVTEANSGTLYPTFVSFVRQTHIFETDPDTGALWTESGFNAAQFGLEILS